MARKAFAALRLTPQALATLVTTLAAALVFSLLLCGCGTSEQGATATDSNTKKGEYISPAEIVTGEGGQPDLWYENGNEKGAYLYFVPANNEAGLAAYFFDKNGNQTDKCWTLAESADNHLKTKKSAEERKIDIVFEDTMTCYDNKTKTRYSRGDLEELNGQLGGTVFYSSTDKTSGDQYAFNNNGEFVETWQGKEYQGTWTIVSATQVYVQESDSEVSFTFSIVFDSKGRITALEDFYGTYPKK